MYIEKKFEFIQIYNDGFNEIFIGFKKNHISYLRVQFNSI